MKSVLVTGAARGIGLQIAKLFAQKGYKVFANYKSDPKELALLNDQNIVAVQADVTKKSEVDAMFEKTGGVDILVNNAGIAQIKPFFDITEADWENMLAVNLKSVFLCSKAYLPHMSWQREGAIINISSIWAISGGSCEAHYSAAKAGIIGFSKALAKEYASSNIRINCIAPGVIDTDMNAGLSKDDYAQLVEQTPLGRIGTADEVAKAVLYLAESTFITGEVLTISGGFGK